MGTSSGIKPQRGGFGGLIDRVLSNNLEKLLAIPGSSRYRKFNKATKDTQATQLAILNEIMTFASGSVFGKEHNFSGIKTYEDFQKSIPILDYEDHRPYIERHQKGEENVLFPGKPLMYNCSSGTTNKPKLIPVTQHNFDKNIKSRAKLWLYGIMRHYPGIYKGKSLAVASPAEEGRTEDGTPYGSLSGLIRKNLPSFINLTHTAPYCAMLIDDHFAKTYTICRMALAQDVSLIVTGNPATILNIAVQTDKYKEEIIKDIRDGTLKSDLQIAPEIRAELESRLEPAPGRAEELTKLVDENERLKPCDYWPNLRLIHCWTNGNTGLVVPKLYDWFGKDTPVLDFGYLSSEILSSDVMIPGQGGSVLAIQSGFYEFLRYEDEDKPDDEKEFLMAHQLEVGKRYFIFITTFSGLYRYDMNDVIEVIDFFNSAPVLKFLYKGKGITNIQGEKLSEAQFIEAVGRAKDKCKIEHEFFIGYADVDESLYKLYIEFSKSYTDEQKQEFGKAVDEALCQVNIEYEAKFKTERIHPLKVIDMGKNFFNRYRDLRFKEGAYEGQIKWLHLSSLKATQNRLNALKSTV